MKSKEIAILSLLCIVALTFCIAPMQAQQRTRHDPNLMQRVKQDDRTAGDWLIISAKRETGAYLCFIAASGIMLASASADFDGEDNMPAIISGGVSIIGVVLLFSSASAKRKAGRALNDAGIALNVNKHGLTLSYKF